MNNMGIRTADCNQRPMHTDPMGVRMESPVKYSAVAPGKLNITLSIGTRQEDGYHALESVMQAVEGRGVSDPMRLHVLGRRGEGTGITVNYEGDTIATAALRGLEREVGKLPAIIEIDKAIPMAAGLGGGSSNAATALRLANVAFDLGYTVPQLAFLASEVGNDIPFLVYGGRGSVSMNGKDVSSIMADRSFRPAGLSYVIAVNDHVELDTRTMYSLLDSARSSYGITTAEQNDFADLAFKFSPVSKVLLGVMRHEGASIESGVTGKGPTVFASYASFEEASEVKRALRSIRREGVEVYTAVASESFAPKDPIP